VSAVPVTEPPELAPTSMQVGRVIEALAEPDRTLLDMIYRRRLTLEHVARDLGLTEAEVRTWLAAVQRKVAEALER
jgi:DNA-directed RNA polymerase specialized sigma24 family protein